MRKTTVQIESAHELPFRCSQCGYEATAIVQGVGGAAYFSSSLLGSTARARDEATRRATPIAQKSAKENAALVLGLLALLAVSAIVVVAALSHGARTPNAALLDPHDFATWVVAPHWLRWIEEDMRRGVLTVENVG